MKIYRPMLTGNITAIVLSTVVTAVFSLLPISSYATVDWTEGFEYASKAAQEAVWPSSCPNDTGFFISSTERPYSGSRSLKMHYRGHQPTGGNPATPGYASCYATRDLLAPTETIYARWYMYMQNFTVDYVSTKVTRHEMENTFPGVWWVFMNGSTALSAAVEGIVTNAGQIDTQTVFGGAVPQNQWVCIETQESMSTPGVDNGIIRQWINGTQTLNKTNQRMRSATQVSANGPNSKFNRAKLYIQDGVGVIFLDDYAVSRDARIGCGSASIQDDTTRPGPPQRVVIR